MKNRLFIDLLPLETSDLIIRKSDEEDALLMVKMDNNESVQKFLGGIKKFSILDRKNFIRKKIQKFNDGIVGMLTVVKKSNKEPIGFIDFKINEKNNNAEISYIFDFDYWNNGFCTQSIERLINLAFNELNLHKVYANTIENNVASIRVLEKVGMIKEGLIREQAYINETIGYKGFINYSILDREYRKEE